MNNNNLEMFTNTKVDDGPCQLVHSDDLKESFERNGDLAMFDDQIERDFMLKINDMDRTIRVICCLL